MSSRHTRPRRMRRAGAGVAAVIGGAVLTGSLFAAGAPAVVSAADDGDDGGASYELLSEGDPTDRTALGGPVLVGDAADTDATITLEVAFAVGGQTLDHRADVAYTLRSDVVAVEPDGSFTTNEQFTAATFTSAGSLPADAFQFGGSIGDLSALIGIPLVADWGPRAALRSLEVDPAATVTPEQQALVDGFEDQGILVRSGIGGLPTEPLGEGAEWVLRDDTFTSGLGVPVAMRLRLAELEGDRYTIELAVEGDLLGALAEELDGADVTGTAAITGTIVGRVGEPLAGEFDLRFLVDAVVTDDAVTADLDMTVDLSFVSTPG